VIGLRSRLLAILALVASSASAAAQWQCKEPTSNEWLKQAPATTKETAIPEALAQPVTNELTEAVARLSSRDFVRLSQADANRFTGQASPSDGKRQPYLVRAVFPVGSPSLRISWSGDDLHVFAEGLGCAQFVKHPIVVYLERDPKHVFVMATAAL